MLKSLKILSVLILCIVCSYSQIKVINEENGLILTHLSDLCVNAKENIYILDKKEQKVVLLNPKNNFIKNIAIKGKGPGEIWGGISIELDENGYLYIYDFSLKRFTIFNKNGIVTKKFHHSLEKFKLLKGGKFLIEISETKKVNRYLKRKFKLCLFSKELKQIKVIDSLEVNKYKFTTSNGPLICPYSKKLTWEVFKENIFIYQPLEEAIKKYDKNGTLIKVVNLKLSKRRIKQEDKEYYLSKLKSFDKDGNIIRGATFFQKKNIEFPKYFSPVKKFMASENELLIQLNDEILSLALVDNIKLSLSNYTNRNLSFDGKIIISNNKIYKLINDDEDLPRVEIYKF